MINNLKYSLDIDTIYTTNSFIYLLRKLPILKDLITDDIYSSTFIKKIIQILVPVYLFLKMLVLKFFYYFLIFSLSYYFFPNYLIKTYFHVYFFLTLLGIFINNKLLNVTKKKYFSLIIFQMEGTSYFKSILWSNQIINTILNTICILFFNDLIMAPLKYSIMMIILTISTRLIGESLNIIFYKKKNYIWYSNSKLYGLVLIIFLGIILLPFIHIFIPINWLMCLTIIIGIISCFSLKYLLDIKDYKQMYQKLVQVVDIMNPKNDKDYLKQAMVDVRDKDKKIDQKRIEKKKGYDYFNTIFFERHREILVRSAKKYSLLSIGVYIVLAYLLITKTSYQESIKNFLENRLGWFVLIMYFVNRGAIITQAMFFNCDHAMLTYSFYRAPKVILELFKKRLQTVAKVNLLPATVIGIGNTILFVLLKENNILIIGTSFLFVLVLSVLFSIHYLVIYYLLQPFNKNLEVKKASYSFVTLGTYFLCYTMTSISINSTFLSLLGIIITIVYTIIALKLVYHFAPKTFKLN